MVFQKAPAHGSCRPWPLDDCAFQAEMQPARRAARRSRRASQSQVLVKGSPARLGA